MKCVMVKILEEKKYILENFVTIFAQVDQDFYPGPLRESMILDSYLL